METRAFSFSSPTSYHRHSPSPSIDEWCPLLSFMCMAHIQVLHTDVTPKCPPLAPIVLIVAFTATRASGRQPPPSFVPYIASGVVALRPARQREHQLTMSGSSAPDRTAWSTPVSPERCSLQLLLRCSPHTWATFRVAPRRLAERGEGTICN